MQGVLPSIEACVPALRRYAQALLRNPQEADDLVHDTLARALGRLHTRRDDGEIRPWLFSIMHNLFVSQARRARVRAWAERLYRGDATIPTVEPDQEQGLRWRDVVQGLQSLPIEQRTVVLLVSLEDLSYAEVARVLGIPMGTVMSRLARGRERLRHMCEGEEARPCLRRVK